MKSILVTILLLSVCCFSYAQEQPGKKQIADKFFEREEYAKAAEMYLDLTNKANPDYRVIERLADCYRLMNDSRSAEQWYASAIAYDKAAAINIYYYAEALLQNKKLKEAKVQYQAYFAQVNDPERLKFKLATCDSAEKWMTVPVKGFALKLEKGLSTVYSDWGATTYGKNDIVFTSDRVSGYEGLKEIDKRTGNSYLKLYLVKNDSIALLPLRTKDSRVFNGDYHVGPAVFNNNADTSWITITTTVAAGKLAVDKRPRKSSQRLYTRRLQLIMATKSNGVWGRFKAFAYNNVSSYSVGHAALSPNGNLLYFTSDMPGGEGGTDIWFCEKQADGSWGKPINCGKAINTRYDEAFPVVKGSDTLTFASKGLPGMGGFDIFFSKGEMADWDTPHNYRYPVNSTSDDFYLLTHNGSEGYLSSNRKGGMGSDDIYSFNYNVPSLVTAAKPIPDEARGIDSKPPQAINVVIYYDLDKANIRADAAAQLDKLAEVLKRFATLKIKLAAYTDARASAGYNINLSRSRALAALEYLASKGIDRERMRASWNGEENLVNNCPDGVVCPETAQQLNRRTEISIDNK
ncbi:OmpA family protein [Mucilaginibacter terrenus]|uniref:OmpA family protein n=1 Tax=Mucilaginibacter terrenus TaxID=2482727 RepID=A0A3E2NTD4_9SPHI|nr:OmpA family protein [Mucilaginibacter terrenus]RFZ84273.1 OmpA family protein [Mucilaginibacter terrenus]